MDKLISFAKALGAFGVKGEIRISLLDVSKVIGLKANTWYLLPYPAKVNDSPKVFTLKTKKMHGLDGKVCLKEVLTREEAQLIKGTFLFSRKDFPPPTDDKYFLFDLIGLQAINTKKEYLGLIVDVVHNNAQYLAQIKTKEEKKFFIPLVPSYQGKVDFKNRFQIFDWDLNWN